MREPCTHCHRREADFVAVSADYQRMLVICTDCFQVYADEADWFFAPASPDIKKRVPERAARSA